MTPAAAQWEPKSLAKICGKLRRPYQGDLSQFPFRACGRSLSLRISRSSLVRSTFQDLEIKHSRFDDVDFSAADLRDIADKGNQFRSCRFVKSDFRGATIGFEGSEYSSCRFERCFFQNAGFVRPQFVDCTFDHCALDNIDFEASSFTRCMFVGPLRNIWFRNQYSHPALAEDFGPAPTNRMQRVDFSEATFWGTAFGGQLDLSTVIPPTDGRHRLYDRWPDRFDSIAMNPGRFPAAAQDGVSRFLHAFAPSSEQQDYFIINEADLIEMFGGKAAESILTGLGLALR